MRILITGKEGQLGKSIKSIIDKTQLKHEFIFIDKSELDLSNSNSINNFFQANSFNIIINCAAYTSVDCAESEANIANQINHLAVKQLAEISNKQGAKLIHISTDYVFDGKSDTEYLESDPCNPINVYGITKLAGEKAICDILPYNAVIIRTSWLYSEFGNNFLDTMLRLGNERGELSIVDDQFGSPTYAGDLANIIIHISNTEEFININFVTQIYNYSNIGQCSWYEFTKEIFKLSDTKCTIHPISIKKRSTKAKRPVYTVLNKDKITGTYDINIPKWRDSLGKCIRALQQGMH